MMDAGLRRRFRRLRRVVIEVESVLTDGSTYWARGGEVFKRFFRPDWVGLSILRKQGIEVILLVDEGKELVTEQAARFDVTDVRDMPPNRVTFLEEIERKSQIDLTSTGYIAGESDAVPVAGIVGIFAVPAGATPSLVTHAHYVATSPPGFGAVREVVEVMLGNIG